MGEDIPSKVQGSKLPWTTTSSGGLRLQKEGSAVVIYRNKWKPYLWQVACFFDAEGYKPLFFEGKFASREEAALYHERGDYND